MDLRFCATRLPANPRSWRKHRITWRWLPSIARWRPCRELRRRNCGNPNPRRFTVGARRIVNKNLRKVDLSKTSVRELNQTFHNLSARTKQRHWRIVEPRGAHAIACGLNVPITVEIDGHAGYYCAGMNQLATVIIRGNTGVGVAENMMSGLVHVKGNASQSAGATGHGGL